jgi:sigma54-dependent transcription regulator
MTDPEKELLHTLSSVRSQIAEQIAVFQRVLDRMDDVALKAVVFLISRGEKGAE